MMARNQKLKPVVETCIPRDDVLAGKLEDRHFAAQLDQLVRDPSEYPIYGDPEKFFQLTFPTTGLRHLLERTFGRLSGAEVEGAQHGVIRSETSFGGGKTHGLMAVYHLAKGARPTNLEEFIDPGLLPSECQVAAAVGDALDPESGLETNGIRTHTLWGEIAAQLGPDAFAKIQPSEEGRTAPGKETWAEAFGGKPTIVIIDEIAPHLRQLVSSGNSDVRRMAQAIAPFLKNLCELAAGTPNVVVIITLATTADAFGKQTDELSELLDDIEVERREALSDVQGITARVGSIVKPAEDREIGEILKRRLFKSIDTDAAEEAAEAYARYYEGLIQKGEELAGGAEAPATYGESIKTSYPFHPELIRVLDKRIGAIERFQRARGALRLLAEMVAGLWESGSDAEIINVADLDFERDKVRQPLTLGIDRPGFEGVALADFASLGSHAEVVDSSRFAGRLPYATRAATTVFVHSLEQVATAGAGRNDYLLGTLRIRDDPAVLGEALAELERSAWHLFYDGTRWRFQTEPNANKIVDEEKRNVPKSQVNTSLVELIERAFPSEGKVKAIHFAADPADVPDEERLQLAIFHHDDLAVTVKDATPPPDRLGEILDRAGAGGSIRNNRNAVVFLVADSEAKDAMRDRVRASLAAAKIVGDSDRMQTFSAEVQKKLRGIADSAKLEARVAIARCYKHLYYPTTDKSNKHLRHWELSVKAQGEANKPQTRVILQMLTDEGKIRATKIPTDYLKSKAWPKEKDEVTTADIAAYFWRDHGAHVVLDETLLRDVIRDGVRNGSWILRDAQAQRTWTSGDADPRVEISQDMFLYTLKRAEELGLLGREVCMDDVREILSEGPTIGGIELREQLEDLLGRDVKKAEIAEVLARGAEGGERASVVVVTGSVDPGAKSCTPAEIKKQSLDKLVVLTPEEAQKRSIELVPGRAKKRVEAKGVAGVAFQALADRVADASAPGLSTLSITASAEPGEGFRDLSLLAKAISQLPKHNVGIDLDIELDFDGLKPGIEIKLAGSGRSYQQIEDALAGLAKVASNVGGTLRLDFSFDAPRTPSDDEFEQIRRVVSKIQPGDLVLKGVLA